MSGKVECVQVVVRCRPLNEKEIQRGCKKVVTVNESNGEIFIGNTNDSKQYAITNEPNFSSSVKKQQSAQVSSKMFTFDKAFGEKFSSMYFANNQ